MFIEQLNHEQYAGFSNWRLPTLEELMLLREPIKSRDLHIDSAFDVKQVRCWTIDETEDKRAKVVDFTDNTVSSLLKFSSQYVRAVRSLN